MHWVTLSFAETTVLDFSLRPTTGGAVSSLSGDRGAAPAEIEFGAF